MLRALRHLLRLIVIARTLARHGALAPLQSAMDGMGLAPVLLVTGRFFGIGGDPHRFAQRPGQRMAAALVALGPAFIKLGQMLSTRSDLIGEEAAAAGWRTGTVAGGGGGVAGSMRAVRSPTRDGWPPRRRTGW